MGVAKRPAEYDDDVVLTGVQPAKKARTGGSQPAPRRRRVKKESTPDASEAQPKKKRARRSKSADVETAGGEYDDAESPKKKPVKESKDEEKRLKRWRRKAPQAWLDVRDRALTQRMFALDRKRDESDREHPTETISLAGTTGNVYTIMIDKIPSCNCPHAMKGNQCKHVVYVLSRVLRVKRQELEYQLAFTSMELREIFEQAPPLPSETAEESEKDGNRKAIEGECPICVVDFEPESGEKIVYCKASCGNNIHAECFNMWKATKPVGRVTCPFCRTPWQEEAGNLKALAGLGAEGPNTSEGYVNVASQLGLSGRRDHSSYNSFWMRQQLRRGEIGFDEDGAMEHDYDDWYR